MSCGHISRVVWIHPPWADQIPDGTYVFTIGNIDEIWREENMDVTVETEKNKKEEEEEEIAKEEIKTARNIPRIAGVSCSLSYYLDDASCVGQLGIQSGTCKDVRLSVCTNCHSVNQSFRCTS